MFGAVGIDGKPGAYGIAPGAFGIVLGAFGIDSPGAFGILGTFCIIFGDSRGFYSEGIFGRETFNISGI